MYFKHYTINYIVMLMLFSSFILLLALIYVGVIGIVLMLTSAVINNRYSSSLYSIDSLIVLSFLLYSLTSQPLHISTLVRLSRVYATYYSLSFSRFLLLCSYNAVRASLLLCFILLVKLQEN